MTAIYASHIDESNVARVLSNGLSEANNALAGVRGSLTRLPRSSRGVADLKSARAMSRRPKVIGEIVGTSRQWVGRIKAKARKRKSN